ncbi:hypothetical protein CC86DRAFT_386898 [Ophiobolus disseminans]|uniref:CorA-like transporter domain-containing protein n=1 Tax=Ophiobolus disseminans TaxID=1469910 RepID=A0A6A6ZIA2_9PLEO|nr:hypothetical protein CC86DRAFT_386898 [Ophiobolus disseminans]
MLLQIHNAARYIVCVPYVEQHGRPKPKDPWSFRRYAVYQHYSQSTRTSSWILIQPREETRQCLETGKISLGSRSLWASFYTHLRIIKSSSRSWRWFLNYLSDELDQIRVKVICQTDPTKSQGSDEICFMQSQTLEIIQAKARRASSAIAATTMIIQTIDQHLDRLSSMQKRFEPMSGSNDGRDFLHDELQQFSNHLTIHARKARDIIEETASINMLIQRTLDLRNALTLHTSNTSLRAISASAAIESTSMLHLTALSLHDARIMKIASIIALMYLPAGLVSSIFSTELVSLTPVRLDLWKGVVVFFMLLGILTTATVCVAVLWIKRDRKAGVVNKAVAAAPSKRQQGSGENCSAA